MQRRSLEERFWAKVDRRRPDDCWMWTASKKGPSYGSFWYKGRSINAHRMVWILERGPIPLGLFVCHHCDVGMCVNPAHLFLGTPGDNLYDAETKGHLIRCGEGNGMAKINEEIVREIRQLRADGYPVKTLAGKFSISIGCVEQVIYRKTWRHVS